jgi:hypothetical protein
MSLFITEFVWRLQRMKIAYRLALLFVLLLAAFSAYGQQTGITGVVTDPQGAIIQGARVQVKQEGGASFFSITNDHGVYVVPNLTAAEYTITVSAPNFSNAEKKVLLLVGQLAQINIALPVASASTQIEVEASGGLAIDTTSSEVAGNVTPEEVQDMPVNGRNYGNFATTATAGTGANAYGSPIASSGAPFEYQARSLQFIGRFSF